MNNENGRDGEEDRLSSLPDTMLLAILSFLDMKHAVQTTILSKRWRDLWTSLRNLRFNSGLFYSPTTKGYDGFQKFVDQVLILRDNSDIDTFHFISADKDCEIKSRFDTWILSVIRSKVRQLCIIVWEANGIPNSLFTCNTLTKLKLWLSIDDRWSITLPDSMCLPNLLILKLYSVSFHDEYLTNKFFLSCPNLEKLYLDDVEFLEMNVNISCLKLKRFKVDNYRYCSDSKFNLHAPVLSYFSCKDYMFKDYIMDNLSSLVKADFDMKVEERYQNPESYSKLPAERKQMYAQRLMQCLGALLSVEVLKVSAWFLQVVSESPNLLEGETTELCYLTCLRLKTWLSVDTIRAIAYLLKISPNIEYLFLQITQAVSGTPDLLEGETTKLCHLTCLRLETWLSVDTIRAITYLLKISPNIESLFLQIIQINYVSEYIGDYLEAEVSLHCLWEKLEIVKIEGAIGCANELNFLQLLLKNAKVLKKLVVYTSTEHSPDSKKRFRKFTEKLLMFPRASSNITILFF